MSHAAAPSVSRPPSVGRPSLGRVFTTSFSDTPGRLRVVGVASLIAGVTMGLSGFAAIEAKANALQAAKANAAQLVVLDNAYTLLVAADAQATNLFLVGGLESTLARQVYLSDVQGAGQYLSQAGIGTGEQSSGADITAAHTDLVTYSGLIESARANNRQGYPIGAAYLKAASKMLRDKILPLLAQVQARDEAAVHAALNKGGGGQIIGVGAGVLIFLGATQLWVARASRRILNLGLLMSSVVVVAILAGSALALGWAQSLSQNVSEHAFADTLAIARSRIDAFDAKSNESLTLISRGSGEEYEKAYQAKVASALHSDEAVTGTWADARASVTGLRRWSTVHVAIRRLDDGGS